MKLSQLPKVTIAGLIAGISAVAFATPQSLDFTPVSVCDDCWTLPFGINEKGTISGAYYTPTGEYLGFVKKGDTYTAINIPGAGYTEASKVNSNDEVVGDYLGADGIGRPFVLKPDGTIVLKPEYPGAAYTLGLDINSQGDILGFYTTNIGYNGYLRSSDGVDFSFTYPGANVTSTFPTGMNEKGEIVGAFMTTTPGEEHGFYRDENGIFHQLDYPGSIQTEAFDINARGDIVGRYTDVDGVTHGYLLRDGHYTTVDYVGPSTDIWSIANNGNAAGYSFDTASGPYSPPTSGFQVKLKKLKK